MDVLTGRFLSFGWKTLVAILALGGVFNPPAWAGGISTHFAELRVSNLQPGHVYVGSRDVTGEPYKVENKTDDPLDFRLVVNVPEPSQLQPGFEPIPDPSWITCGKAFFTAQAHQAGITDFYISIPTGTAHIGKKYQAQIGVMTFGGPAFVQMGLMGRAFLSVGDTVLPWTEADRRAHMFSAQLTLSPPAQAADLSKSTKRVALNALLQQPFVVKNGGDYPVRCRVEVVETKESFVYPPPGFTPVPKGVKVKLRHRRFVIAPHSEKEIEGTLRVSRDLLGRVRNCYVVLRAVTEGTPGEVEAYSRLFLKEVP